MRILLATLCLNEMEWLPRLYQQHKDWPGVVSWHFVEAADKVYADTSPSMVSEEFLSVDETSRYLLNLSNECPEVKYTPFGLTQHRNPDQGKCPARDAYMEWADEVEPDFVFIIDADEFYTFEDQERISAILARDKDHKSFCFPHTHPWRPPSIRDKELFSLGVQGGLWKIGFIRGWRWEPGLRYRANHNHLSDVSGQNLNRKMLDLRRHQGDWKFPHCVHMGFTASLRERRAKHQYYAVRGEQGSRRNWHVTCRSAFETWKPGRALPHGARVSTYEGPIPECFR